jgi:transposase
MLNLAMARIWLCVEPTDMRKSFDTLAARVREHLRADPLCGAWFLWQKRLAKGTFEFPKVIGKGAGVEISATDLALILGGVALNAKRRMRYTRTAPTTIAN